MVMSRDPREEMPNWNNSRKSFFAGKRVINNVSFTLFLLFLFVFSSLVSFFNIYGGLLKKDNKCSTFSESLPGDDLDLIKYIRKHIEPPTNKGLVPTIGSQSNLNKFSPSVLTMTFIYKYLQKELHAGGSYVEIGAGDGGYESNSLRLDTVYNWHGLIIEPNNVSYQNLRKTKRHAMTGNFCVSPTKYSMYSNSANNSKVGQNTVQMECYPLLSILSAIGMQKGPIDFMSIKSGGAELDIIKTLPDNIIIKVLYIDHRNIPNGRTVVSDFLVGERDFTWVHETKEHDTVVGSIFLHNSVLNKPY